MSVNYGGPPAGGASYGGGNTPYGRVSFGWIGESFELYKANIGVWIVATLMAFVPSIAGAIVGGIFGAATAGQHPGGGQPPFGSSPTPFGGQQNSYTGGLPPPLYFGIQVMSALYSAWLSGGVYGTAVKQVRGEAISVNDIFSGGPLIWKMLGFNIVYTFAVALGWCFCLVPGFLLSGLLFPAYALIADGETVGNAITRSFEAMKRDMWNAGAFILVMGLIVLAGIIPCGLGLLVTLPMLYLATALAYRDMIGMPGPVNRTGAYGAPAGYGAAQSGVWPPPPEARPPAFGQPPSSDPSSFSPPRRSLSGEDLGASEQPPTPPPAA